MIREPDCHCSYSRWSSTEWHLTFFNISGSLFVEQEVQANIRASAQGLFMFMTNGLGAMIGGYCSGLVVGGSFRLVNGISNWPNIWFAFAGYALVLGIPVRFQNTNTNRYPRRSETLINRKLDFYKLSGWNNSKKINYFFAYSASSLDSGNTLIRFFIESFLHFF